MTELTTTNNELSLSTLHKVSIQKAENELLKYEQAECNLEHIYGPGLYIRQVTLPKGAFVIGHHQNFAQMNVMISGKVEILNDDGTTTMLVAPQTFVGKPGRKIGFIHETCVWQNVYAETEQDVEVLEAKYLTKSEESLRVANQVVHNQLLLTNKVNNEQLDYKALLQELNLTEEEVQLQVQNTEDRIDLPAGSYKFETGPSVIHGTGVFATSIILPEERIGIARIGDKRTVLGRLVNHSCYPNAVMIPVGDNIELYALQTILGKSGNLSGNEITVDYRFTLKQAKELELHKYK